MSKSPQYLKDGWAPHGPGRCRCPSCGTAVSTNALARAQHKCPEPKAASAKPASTLNVRDICLAKAIQAIEKVCREKEPGGSGAVVISDLATWEIERRLTEAVKKALS